MQQRTRAMIDRLDTLGVADEVDRWVFKAATHLAGLWSRRPFRRVGIASVRPHEAIENAECKVRELFRRDVRCRLAAARWLGERGCGEATAVLQGVLSIEENEAVRCEIVRALRQIDTRER